MTIFNISEISFLFIISSISSKINISSYISGALAALTGNIKNDFAIILLQQEVSLNQKINVIQLPIEDISCPVGKSFIISGWGMDRYKNKDIDPKIVQDLELTAF